MSGTSRFKQTIIERDGFTCHYCQRPLDNLAYALDHVVPRARGGKDRLGNLVLACAYCNGHKSDKDYESFKLWLADNPPPAGASLLSTYQQPPIRRSEIRIHRAAPRPIWIDPRLVPEYGAAIGPIGLATYLALVGIVDCGQGGSYSNIAAMIGATTEEVGSAIDTLVQLGIITRQDQGEGYVLTLAGLPEGEVA